jgi:hypothetical protein
MSFVVRSEASPLMKLSRDSIFLCLLPPDGERERERERER